MGRRLNRKALLEEIRLERAALDNTLATLTRRQMTQRGVTPGGWSVKDILAHLVEWQHMNILWYEAGLRGETPHIPAEGMTMRETPKLNQMIYKKHHRRSLDVIMDEYRAYHEKMIDLIESLSNEDLVTLGRYSWTGPSWTLSDYLRASTAAHYLWALQRIRRWLNAQRKES